MKSVVFINPPTPGFRKITRNVDCASESKGNYLLQPFDFLLLSGAFSPEVPITVLDCVADKLDPVAAFEKLREIDFGMIVTAMIDGCWEDDFLFVSRLRERYPEIPILAFGDALIEENNTRSVEAFVDGIITSPLLFNPSILSTFNRKEISEKKRELGLREPGFLAHLKKAPQQRTLFTPRHELFLNPNYRWPFSSFKKYSTVITSWGCPYSCAYCTASKLPSLYRKPDEILAELKHIRSLGVREVYFGDKSFGIPAENTKKILEAMIENDLAFSWSTYFHPSQYTPELLSLMKKAGCHTIIIGIETADLSSLSRFNRRISKEKVEALIEHANRLRINVCGDFIFGLPEENRDAMMRTLDYSLKLKLDYASFNIASPLPGSIIKKLAIQDSRMTENDHHFDSVGRARALASDQMTGEELKRLRNRAVRRFYLRPLYLMRRLMRLRGWEHFVIQLSEMFEIMKKAN